MSRSITATEGLGGAAIVTALLVRAGQRAGVLADYDDGVYWQTGLAVAAGHRPYTGVFFSQPPLFAEIVALPFRLGAPETVARLGALGWAALLIAAAGLLGRAVADARGGLIAALTVALLPPMQRYSWQFGADLPSAALAACGLVLAVHARERPRWWLAAGALLGTALLVKLVAVVALPAVLVVALRRPRAVAWAGAGLGGAVAGWLAVLHPAPGAAWRQVVGFHLDASAGDPAPLPAATVRLIAAWAVPLAVLAAAGAVVALRRGAPEARRPVVALLVWAAAGLPFAWLFRPLFEHQLLLFAAPAGALVGAGLSRLPGAAGWWRTALAATAAVVLVVQAALVPVLPRLETTAILGCLRALPPGALILTDDQELAARAGLRVPPQLADTSRVRSNSGHLTPARIIAESQAVTAALFAPTGRGKISDRTVRAWVEQRFPARYLADGYRLYATPGERPGCPSVTGK